MAGDRALDERRSEAMRRITNGRSGMAHLRLLLDQGSFHPKVRRRGKTASGLDRYFDSGITLKQREAIDVALSTPDVALIQGPPGTGKTQVVSALLDALAQELEGLPPDRRVLLTGEQQEAVRNAVERYSEDSGTEPFLVVSSQEDADAAHRRVRQRARAIQERVNERTPHLVELVRLERLAADSSADRPLSAGECVTLCDRLGNLARALGSDHARQVHMLRDRARRASAARLMSEESPVMVAVRAIPTSVGSLRDGGMQLLDAWIRPTLAGHLEPDQRTVLDRTNADSLGSDPDGSVRRLTGLRDDLVRQWSTSGLLEERDFRADARTVAERMLASAQARWGSADDPAMRVALDCAQQLLDDPEEGVRSVATLSGVAASTNARVVRRELQSFQNVTSADNLWFDTVIIDEAAHANPLDLLIPMSLARRRIILVGDHRQLPMMLEPAVESAIRGIDPEARPTELTSLFEHLMGLVDEERRRSGVHRRVTLDTQFRMPRSLGDFLGRNFYADDGGLKTGVDDPDVTHSDPDYAGECYGWLDVRGGDERGHPSRRRPDEAAAVATLVSRWMNLPNRPTIGAVATYRGQVMEILRELVPYGLAEADEHGRVSLTAEAGERLKVGTVDAFQGRQFDHVVLSLVRSNKQTDPRRRYGFLTLPNRLCVAMSRQRQLLVVAGRLSMFTDDQAERSVPALAEFARMCREGDRVRR